MLKKSLFLLTILFILLSGCATTEPYEQKEWHQLGMMSDEVLDEVLLFYLGNTWQQSADINECLETAGRVDIEDPESWSREWKKTAQRLEARARERLAAGHVWSAGEYFLRASTYYRASMHRHMHPDSPEIPEMTEKEIECFVRSQELLERPMEVVLVPFEEIQLTGYFYKAPTSAGPAPTLIVHQGRDGWAEDCKYYADEALRRGYNCLLIDGPGNGQVLRKHHLPFRPDWETFVTPVIDYLETREEVDKDKIILVGISMGGFLAPRAAAFEHRLRICVANPGVLDWGEVFFEKLAEYSPELLSMYNNTPKVLDSIIGVMEHLNPFLMWGLTDTMWKHGTETPREMLDSLKTYTNKETAANITASMLVINAEFEPYGQAMELFEAVPGRKTFMVFTEEEAAPLHVQTGSLAVSICGIFDWIDKELGR